MKIHKVIKMFVKLNIEETTTLSRYCFEQLVRLHCKWRYSDILWALAVAQSRS